MFLHLKIPGGNLIVSICRFNKNPSMGELSLCILQCIWKSIHTYIYSFWSWWNLFYSAFYRCSWMTFHTLKSIMKILTNQHRYILKKSVNQMNSLSHWNFHFQIISLKLVISVVQYFSVNLNYLVNLMEYFIHIDSVNHINLPNHQILQFQIILLKQFQCHLVNNHHCFDFIFHH